MNTIFTTRNEAIDRLIIEPLGEFADEHDIDAIADEVLTTTGEGVDYRWTIDEDADFWEIVANNQL